LLRQLGFRVGTPESPNALHRALHKQENSDIAPGVWLNELWNRFQSWLAPLPPDVKLRLSHIYQVFLQPAILQQRSQRFVGLTWLPPQRLGKFPEDGWIDVRELRLLSLSYRPHREEGQSLETMLDLKLHKLQIDPESLQVFVGGPRTIYARYFSWPLGAWPRGVPVQDDELIRAGLTVHRAIEMASVAMHHIEREVRFPEIYLAFLPYRHDELFEPTVALETAIVFELDRWLLAGRPKFWPAFMPRGSENADRVMVPLQKKIAEPCKTWGDVCRQLKDYQNDYRDPYSDGDSRHLLLNYWYAQMREHQGLHLMPLKYFRPDGSNRLFRRSVKIFAYMPLDLVGADVEAAQVLGAKTGGLAGQAGNTGWDFRTAPPGLEKAFLPAEARFEEVDQPILPYEGPDTAG
jgi:hypothetical protein